MNSSIQSLPLVALGLVGIFILVTIKKSLLVETEAVLEDNGINRGER
jgi:hypothetical protein